MKGYEKYHSFNSTKTVRIIVFYPLCFQVIYQFYMYMIHYVYVMISKDVDNDGD